MKKANQALRQIIKKALNFVMARAYLKTMMVFSFYFLLFLAVYFSVDTLSTGDDHFFHFKFAELMREKGFFNSFEDFKAIYFSKMAQGNEYFVYYDFLFYLIIIPFTFIKPLFLGIKLYAVFAASLTFLSIYWISKRINVRKPFLWTAILVGVMGMTILFRLFLSRPYTLAPVLLLLIIYSLHKKKYFSVFFFTLFYFFWHSTTFFFPLSVAAVYFIFEMFYGHKGDRKNLLSSTLGTGAGLALVYTFAHGFFKFIDAILFGIFSENVVVNKVPLPLGSETYPIDFFDFIKADPLFMCVFLISISVFIYRYLASRFMDYKDGSDMNSDWEALQGSMFFLSICYFLGMFVVSGRFKDFFVVIAGVFIIMTLDSVAKSFEFNDNIARKALHVGVKVCIVFLFISSLLSLQSQLAVGLSVENLRPVGEWLNKNVPEHQVIFSTSWSFFSQLYYHSPTHYYVAGLNPRYFYVFNQALYWKWTHISENGYVCDQEVCDDMEQKKNRKFKDAAQKNAYFREVGNDIANIIKAEFHSNYMLISVSNKSLMEVLTNSDKFEKVFSDRDTFYIYKVN